MKDDIAILCSCEREINSEIKWKKYLGFPIVKQYIYLGI